MRPEVSPLTEEFYAALGWWTTEDEANGWPLLLFCAAWVETLLDPVYELVSEGEDGEPAWLILLDPDRCPGPSLPYLAQYDGAILTPEMDEAQRRAEIKEPTGWARGRVPAIRLVAQRTLTGTKRVIIRPRKPEPGHYYIRTLADETPDPARVEVALREEGIPVWDVLDYDAISGVTWADIAAGWASWSALTADFVDWADVADLLPEELP